MSRPYGWIITADHIAEPGTKPGTNLNAVGMTGPRDLTDELEQRLKKGDGAPFQMLDSDGELYYEGRLIGGDGFEPLEDFGQPNAGASEIRFWDERELQWVEL